MHGYLTAGNFDQYSRCNAVITWNSESSDRTLLPRVVLEVVDLWVVVAKHGYCIAWSKGHASSDAEGIISNKPIRPYSVKLRPRDCLGLWGRRDFEGDERTCSFIFYIKRAI